MTRHRLFIGFIVAVTFSESEIHAEDAVRPRTIQLDGPRNAQATVTVAETEYVIAAEMVPVDVFDEPTNRDLNQRLLTRVAFRALARFLSDEPIRLTVTGIQAENLDTHDEISSLTIRVPRSGVAIRPTSPEDPLMTRTSPADSAQNEPTASVVPKDDNRDRLIVRSGLLSRNQEYRTLIENLADLWEADLQDASGRNDGDAVPNSAIENITKRASESFRALNEAIQKDLLLLSVEKSDLVQQLGARERRLLKAIRSAQPREIQTTPKGEIP